VFFVPLWRAPRAMICRSRTLEGGIKSDAYRALSPMQ
jgi:hypothetical protein